LDVIFRGKSSSERDEAQVDVFYASRSIPVVDVTPVLSLTPQPTMTPTSGSAPAATPTPRPAVNPVAPSPAPPSLSLGPVALPLVSLGGLVLVALGVVVAGVLALHPLWARRR